MKVEEIKENGKKVIEQEQLLQLLSLGQRLEENLAY